MNIVELLKKSHDMTKEKMIELCPSLKDIPNIENLNIVQIRDILKDRIIENSKREEELKEWKKKSDELYTKFLSDLDNTNDPEEMEKIEEEYENNLDALCKEYNIELDEEE